MATYVISEIDYWGGNPIIKIRYAGQDRDEAIKEFDKYFKLSCWNTAKNKWYMISPEVAEEVGEDQSYETVLKYLIRKVDDEGKVVIDSDWDNGEGDYPLYLQYIKVND